MPLPNWPDKRLTLARPAVPRLTVLLLVVAAITSGCQAGRAVLPTDTPGEMTPSLDAVSVKPSYTNLSLVGPGSAVQLELTAYDQAGRALVFRETPSYTTDAPEIATVSSTGLVTAVGAGTATITTKLTIGTVARTGAATVHVIAPPTPLPTIVDGVFDLVAPITSWDPAWGDLTGSRYIATLRFQRDPNAAPGIVGTFTDFSFAGPEGISSPQSGVITMTFDPRTSRIEIELVSTTAQFTMTLGPEGDFAAARVIQGSMGRAGHIGGTFTATRRAGP